MSILKSDRVLATRTGIHAAICDTIIMVTWGRGRVRILQNYVIRRFLEKIRLIVILATLNERNFMRSLRALLTGFSAP